MNWDSELDSIHKVPFETAENAFKKDYSAKPGYKEGVVLLRTGIICAKGFMKIDGSLKQDEADYEKKKLILECIEEYKKALGKKKANATKASTKALKHFDNHARSEFGAARGILVNWLDSLQRQTKGETTNEASGENIKHTEVKAKGKFFEFKRNFFEEVKTFSEQIQPVFHGEQLKEVIRKKIYTFNKDASNLERSLGKTEGKFTKEVDETVNIAFDLLKTRDDSLEPFRDQSLYLDLKWKSLQYLTEMVESLDDAYILPDALDKLHSVILQKLLPTANEDDTVLRKHREDVKTALDQLMEDTKTWNEENRMTFSRVIDTVAGGASEGSAYYSISVVGMLGTGTAVGIGAALGVGVLVVAGGALAFILLRKKNRHKHYEEQIKQVKEGKLPEFVGEDQNERNKDQMTHL